jgi:hypothetical protein
MEPRMYGHLRASSVGKQPSGHWLGGLALTYLCLIMQELRKRRLRLFGEKRRIPKTAFRPSRPVCNQHHFLPIEVAVQSLCEQLMLR